MIFKIITELLSEQFCVEPDEITLTTTLEDLGADSLDVVELSMALEEEFDIPPFEEDDMEKFFSVSDLVKFIESQIED